MDFVTETSYILDNRNAFSAVPPALAPYALGPIPGAMMFSNAGCMVIVKQDGETIVRNTYDQVTVHATITTHGELVRRMSEWLNISVYPPSYYRDCVNDYS